MGKTKKKFYNPYPFVIRVLNDLGKAQILAPQAHCKIFQDALSKVAITLLPKAKKREYRDGLGLELMELTKARLISIAWTVLVDKNEEELNKMIKADIVSLIEQKTGEEEKIEEVESRQDIDLLDEDSEKTDETELEDISDKEETEEEETEEEEEEE